MKLNDPAASSGTVTCRPVPPRTRDNSASLSSRSSVTVRMSPSTSESLANTSMAVVRPARTWNWSSRASGGVFLSLRLGLIRSVTSSSSASPFSGSGGVSWSQPLIRFRFSVGSQMFPLTVSLRTTTSRFTRKTSSPSPPYSGRSRTRAGPPQPSTTWALVPVAKAPKTQPPTRTGTAGVPLAPEPISTRSPPEIPSRPPEPARTASTFASAVSSPASDGACRTAPWASGTSIGLPPSSHTWPAARSSTRARSPTALSSTSAGSSIGSGTSTGSCDSCPGRMSSCRATERPRACPPVVTVALPPGSRDRSGFALA